jgi:hypothetical protein
MKKLWLLLAIALPVQPIHAQEVKHAPTVEQRRADQRLWRSKLDQAPIPSRSQMSVLRNWLTDIRR